MYWGMQIKQIAQNRTATNRDTAAESIQELFCFVFFFLYEKHKTFYNMKIYYKSIKIFKVELPNYVNKIS